MAENHDRTEKQPEKESFRGAVSESTRENLSREAFSRTSGVPAEHAATTQDSLDAYRQGTAGRDYRGDIAPGGAANFQSADKVGIVTTYDQYGNPTSDCHGPIPRPGTGKYTSPLYRPEGFPKPTQFPRPEQPVAHPMTGNGNDQTDMQRIYEPDPKMLEAPDPKELRAQSDDSQGYRNPHPPENIPLKVSDANDVARDLAKSLNWPSAGAENPATKIDKESKIMDPSGMHGHGGDVAQSDAQTQKYADMAKVDKSLLESLKAQGGLDKLHDAATETTALQTGPKDDSNKPTEYSAEAEHGMSAKEVEAAAQKVIDTVKASGNLGSEEQRKEIEALFKDAQLKDSLPDLIGQLNAQMAKEGLDFRFSMSSTTKTHITMDGPTFLENNFNIALKTASSGRVVDRSQFSTTTIADYNRPGWGA